MNINLEAQNKLSITTESADETKELAQTLGALLEPGIVLGLIGDLGAGKTCFVKGLARGLGVEEVLVTSPTFVLLHRYDGRVKLYHFDCYRLDHANEIFELGFYEFLEDGIVVIEWFEKIDTPIRAPLLTLDFQILSETSRRIRLTPHCAKTVEVCRTLHKSLSESTL